MKRTRQIKAVAVALSCLGMLVPHSAMAVTPTQDQPAPTIADVALAAGGVLNGQVLDPQGAPLVGLAVAVGRQDQLAPAIVTTDEQGRFAVADLRGGMYRVAAGDADMLLRAWAPQTAPPAAQHGVLLVSGDDLARGQGPWRYWLSNPWVIGAAVATAIAVPIALTRSKKSG
jgi:hypothetical protein